MRSRVGWSFGFSWGTRPLRQPWHSIWLAVAGTLLVGSALYFAWTTRTFLRAAVETEGTVVSVVRRGDVYYPVVRYTAPGSGTRLFHSSTGSNPPQFAVDERVRILYERDNPADVRIKSVLSLWGLGIIWGVVGAALWLAAILMWVYRRRLFPQPGYRG